MWATNAVSDLNVKKGMSLNKLIIRLEKIIGIIEGTNTILIIFGVIQNVRC